MIEFGSI